MGIAAKLVIAAKACEYVQKDGNNLFHKYRFVSAAAILAHVSAGLAEAGLAVVDTLPEVVSTEGTGKERIVTVRMTVVVADTESEERATFRGLGSGMDSGDKAVMKATTAATKYAWMGAFSISTGDDPEADEETDKRASGSKGGAKQQPQRQTPQRREEPMQSEPTRSTVDVDPPAPAEPSAALVAFLERVETIELPGEAVAVWMKISTEIAKLAKPEIDDAWSALVKRTEHVGKMKNARLWLRKAVEEERARGASKPAEAQVS